MGIMQNLASSSGNMSDIGNIQKDEEGAVVVV
jgi:hypothetical protein